MLPKLAAGGVTSSLHECVGRVEQHHYHSHETAIRIKAR